MLQMWMNIIGYVHSLRHSWTLLKIKRNLLKIQVINNEEIYYSFCLVGMSGGLVFAQDYVSKVWVSDQGDGTYKNPVLYADYSDPDACRVGDDYYLTSSSFGCLPGLQILHSKDLVNWSIIGAALPYAVPPINDNSPQHGNRVWAPSIRYHNGEFYIFGEIPIKEFIW